MNTKYIRQVIYDWLSQVTASEGFQLRKKKEEVFRTIPGGGQSIGVALYSIPQYKFGLVIHTGLDEVEELMHRFSGIGPEYYSSAGTVCINMNKFCFWDHMYVTNEQELDKALKQLKPVVLEKIIPFLDTHQDAVALDQIFNHSQLCHTMQPYRGMAALIVAKMVNNPEFDELVEKYRNELSKKPGIPIEYDMYEALVKYLEEERKRM